MCVKPLSVPFLSLSPCVCQKLCPTIFSALVSASVLFPGQVQISSLWPIPRICKCLQGQLQSLAHLCCFTPWNLTLSSPHAFCSSLMPLNAWLLQLAYQVFLIFHGNDGLYEFFYPFRRPGQWFPLRKGWVVTGRWYANSLWLNLGVEVTEVYSF